MGSLHHFGLTSVLVRDMYAKCIGGVTGNRHPCGILSTTHPELMRKLSIGEASNVSLVLNGGKLEVIIWPWIG